MPSLELIKSTILPRAVDGGGFGMNVEFMGVFEDPTKGKDQFASTIQYLEIQVESSGVLKKFSTVCKFQPESAEFREARQLDSQFYNEVVFYRELLPLCSKDVADLFPKFFFGIATLGRSPKDDVLIIENLIPRGYKQSDERIFLDYNHCAIALKRLGEFHGASLQLKAKSPVRFAHKIDQLIETRWIDKKKEELSYFFSENAKRGIIPLMKNDKYNTILNCFLDKLSDVFSMIKQILEVNEISVLCHGDFCRNNMLFKYEENCPTDVKFYDTATIRYASPVIDISFFVFLNTSVELRRKHFKNDLLKIYHDALRGVAGSLAPSMEELWEEFQKRGIYGYMLVAFFLPIMLRDELEEGNVNQILTVEERVQNNLARGGQKVTDILTQTVEDLIAWGCLK